MNLSELVATIQKDIRKECSNPDDYEAYVDNCMLHDIKACAAWYKITVDQLKFAMSRALLSI